MEQINIIFFALASFFGMENGQVAADKTTVTIDPKIQQIEIVQENLFTITDSEESTARVIKQWKKVLHWSESDITWAKELENFPLKKFNFTPIKDTIQPKITLTYKNERDLRVMGIWYDAEKNQFSINHIPQNNIKTTNGKLDGNYWVFNGDSKFSFTIEPFLQLPEKHRKLKQPLTDLLIENKKK